jgi:hypothetical protein
MRDYIKYRYVIKKILSLIGDGIHVDWLNTTEREDGGVAFRSPDFSAPTGNIDQSPDFNINSFANCQHFSPMNVPTGLPLP